MATKSMIKLHFHVIMYYIVYPFVYMCLFEMHVQYIQWDLFIKDTLGPPNLSTVERLSTLQRWKCISTIRESIFGALESVLCREVVYMVSFIRRVHRLCILSILCIIIILLYIHNVKYIVSEIIHIIT